SLPCPRALCLQCTALRRCHRNEGRAFFAAGLRSIAEAVVQADPQNISGQSEAFRENHAADVVVEDRAIAEIHVKIFRLGRPILIKHRLYPDTGGPADDSRRTRAECAIGGTIPFPAAERSNGKAARQVSEALTHP